MNADKGETLLHRDLTDRVIGAFYEAYNELGYGFLESVYEAALCRVFRDSGIRYERQRVVVVIFRGEPLSEFRLDLVIENQIVVEVKAVPTLSAAHEAQLLNYLKATDLRVGLLLNFGPRAEFRRRVFDASRGNPRSSA
ncbi:MAG: GxxExxY protein [Panacagrimonas sp.]